MIEEHIQIETNSQGYPIFGRSSAASIQVLISNGTDVEIVGDGASLQKLGEVLIGVAKAKGFHVHLESNAETSAFDIKPTNIRLTISNSEMPEQKKPTSLPPDWARG